MYDNFMEDKKNKLEFIILRVDEKCEEAYRHKHNIMPKKLFKYEKVTDSRLKTLKSNQLYIAEIDKLNDPFEFMPIYWDIDKVYQYYISSENFKNLPSQNSLLKTKQELNDYFLETINLFNNSFKIACFSEEIDNLPMWGNYADNGKGFCVEYDFTQLTYDNVFIKQLMPVIYETEKFDSTFTFKRVLDTLVTPGYHPTMYSLFFKNIIKHLSWSYEKEWRYISNSIRKNNIDCPIKPTAIYAGINCSLENINKLKSISNDLNCSFFKMVAATGVNKQFEFTKEELIPKLLPILQ